jgi:hypothetical protein
MHEEALIVDAREVLSSLIQQVELMSMRDSLLEASSVAHNVASYTIKEILIEDEMKKLLDEIVEYSITALYNERRKEKDRAMDIKLAFEDEQRRRQICRERALRRVKVEETKVCTRGIKTAASLRSSNIAKGDYLYR